MNERNVHARPGVRVLQRVAESWSQGYIQGVVSGARGDRVNRLWLETMYKLLKAGGVFRGSESSVRRSQVTFREETRR